jgi:hypothetical protein
MSTSSAPDAVGGGLPSITGRKRGLNLTQSAGVQLLKQRSFHPE